MKTNEEANKALVLEAFDTLFNKRDYKRPPSDFGRPTISSTVLTSRGDVRAFFNLIKSAPPTLRYESDDSKNSSPRLASIA
jgi:hypothetical protein